MYWKIAYCKKDFFLSLKKKNNCRIQNNKILTYKFIKKRKMKSNTVLEIKS